MIRFGVMVSVVLVCGMAVLSAVFLFLRPKNTATAAIKSPDTLAAAALAVPAEALAKAEVQKRFNILIVPGHDVRDGGACYKNICERDLAAAIAQKIAVILGGRPQYEVTVSRDTVSWNSALQEYFDTQKQTIIDWKTARQAESKALMESGAVKYVPDMAYHSQASPEMSVKLYGTNKWADENNIDLVLNLHFNDSGRPKMDQPGGYKGCAIFIPESQMKNHAASEAAADYIFRELKKVEPPEVDNLLEDQSLIALGASGTLGAASMLVEYGYIYEQKLEDETSRQRALDEFAAQTALGIEEYFDSLDKK